MGKFYRPGQRKKGEGGRPDWKTFLIEGVSLGGLSTNQKVMRGIQEVKNKRMETSAESQDGNCGGKCFRKKPQPNNRDAREGN